MIRFMTVLMTVVLLTAYSNAQDDSTAKYGQEFEGKISKSFEDSKKW